MESISSSEVEFGVEEGTEEAEVHLRATGHCQNHQSSKRRHSAGRGASILVDQAKMSNAISIKILSIISSRPRFQKCFVQKMAVVAIKLDFRPPQQGKS
jgi:hypothetical protein